MIRRIIVAGVLCVGMAASVFAFSFGIDQPSVHMTTRPGSIEHKEIVVSNQSDETLSIAVTVEDWVYRDDRTKRFMKKGESPWSCAEWIVPERTAFTIAPRKKETFRFSLKTPDKAAGGHQAVVFFEGLPATSNMSAKNGVLFSGKVGAIIYQHTEGRVSAAAEISEVSASGLNGHLEVRVVFKNTGDDWLQGKGNAVLLDDKGRTVGRGELSLAKTLPGETVAVKADVKGFTVLAPGTYKVLVTIDTGADVLVKETTVSLAGA